MEKTIKVLIFSFVIVFVVAAFNEAYGFRICDCFTAGCPEFCPVIRTDPTAPGAKLNGPLTILYTPTGSDCDDGMPKTDMTFFMRLAHGNTLIPFSGSRPDVCFFDFRGQHEAIETFIRKAVIPVFFPDKPAASFSVKAVKNIVEDNEQQYPSCCGTKLFTIMDITIAVQE